MANKITKAKGNFFCKHHINLKRELNRRIRTCMSDAKMSRSQALGHSMGNPTYMPNFELNPFHISIDLYFSQIVVQIFTKARLKANFRT